MKMAMTSIHSAMLLMKMACVWYAPPQFLCAWPAIPAACSAQHHRFFHRHCGIDVHRLRGLPNIAAEILPIVTDIFIQCKKVRSFAAGTSEGQTLLRNHNSSVSPDWDSGSAPPKNALASVRRRVCDMLAKPDNEVREGRSLAGL